MNNKFLKILVLCLIFCCGVSSISARNNPFLNKKSDDKKPQKLFFDGYVFGLGLLPLSSNIKENQYYQIYNRLNFNYQFNEYNKLSLQFRNLAMMGSWLKPSPSMVASTLDADIGAVDMNFKLIEEKELVFAANIDRFFYQYSKEKIEFTFGRQRINWGRTMAWNPNDIFNASSFLEFDYVEKPGSDAARMVYYLNQTSALDFAFKVDSAYKFTYALKYNFNYKHTDVQVLGGVFYDDLVAGIGWAGNIKQVGFKGEATLFVPVFDSSYSTLLAATVSFDYSLNNGLYFLGQVLYSPIDDNAPAFNPFSVTGGFLTARNLSFTEWNVLAQASYPFSPVVNGSFSLMYFPDEEAVLLFPTFTYSVHNDLDLSLTYQGYKSLKSTKGNSALIIDDFLYLGLKYYF